MRSVSCAFCDIVGGRTAAEIVFEDTVTVAFLDARPLFPGHTLVVPRQHVETLADLAPELIAPVFATARRVAAAVETGLGAAGSFVAVNNRVSQSVPHLHVHVVPRRPKDGLKGFFWPRQKYRDEAEMRSVAEALRAALSPA